MYLCLQRKLSENLVVQLEMSSVYLSLKTSSQKPRIKLKILGINAKDFLLAVDEFINVLFVNIIYHANTIIKVQTWSSKSSQNWYSSAADSLND